MTSISCIPAFTATRQAAAPGALASFKVTDSATVYVVMAGDSDRERRLHRDSAASDIILRRTATRPEICNRPTPDTPLSNFEVFSANWAEQYGFFDLKGANWNAIVAGNRAKVTDSTKPQELFEILKSMVEPFEDAHTNIRATTINQTWSGTRKSPSWLERPERATAFEVIDKNYLRSPIQTWCNGQVQYALLDGNVGYLRIRSFSGYGPAPGFQSGLTALEAALDTVFADAAKWRGLVIDVRINGGGSDLYGLTIASRLATREYLAYSKEARSNPADPSKWTKAQPSRVRPTDRSGFKGQVIVLTGIHSVSAAETFTQALMKREPKVTRIGEHTQGVFSDVLGRRLPNGWRFGLPNERF
ncbi:MAG: S41 family peptidase, partial [Phycisphaerales bacterium]|nr:S41 family peptidase [Phycisphaerales bacterium]